MEAGEAVDSASGGSPARPQPTPPKLIRQRFWSVPCTKSQPSWLIAGPVLGASCPPREVQVDHAVPPQCLYQTAPSVPRTTTSIALPNAGDVYGATAPGDAVSFPPRDCQPDHAVPVHALCQRAPSVPSTKTSRRPAFQEQTAGPVPDASCPPRDSHVDHPFW